MGQLIVRPNILKYLPAYRKNTLCWILFVGEQTEDPENIILALINFEDSIKKV